MAADRRVCDSRHLQYDCQELGSAQEPYAWQSSMGYLYHFTKKMHTKETGSFFVCLTVYTLQRIPLCISYRRLQQQQQQQQR